MGAYSGVGAYLSSSGSEVGAYSGGGLFESGGLIDHLRYLFEKSNKENSKVIKNTFLNKSGNPESLKKSS